MKKEACRTANTTILVLVMSITCASHGWAQKGAPSLLARIQLGEGVSVSIPEDWVAQDAQSNRRRFAQGKMVMDLSGVPAGPGGVLLTASPDGDPDRVSVVISLIRRPSADQADIAALVGERLEQVIRQYRHDLEAGMRVERATLLEWQGTATVRLGSLYSLVSRYLYQRPSGIPRAMESHRIFLGGGSIGFMMQAPVDEVANWQSVFAQIRNSFQAAAIR
jgi:hypothetical protein